MKRMSSRGATVDGSGDSAPPVVNAPFRFWRGIAADARNMIAQRELLRSFVARELRQRYKGSFLGWGWALIRPLVMLGVYGIAVGVFLGANKSIPQFAIYLYSGLIAWGYFSSIVTGCVSALPGNAGLINKAAFQKELLSVAVVAVAAIDLVIQASVLVLAYLAYGAWPSLASLAWVVPGFVVLTLLGLALGLLLSASNVYFRDVGYLTEVGLQVGFWAVPVLYAYSMVQSALVDMPALLQLYTINPIVPAMTTFRLALWPASSSEVGQQQLMPTEQLLPYLFIGGLASILLLWFGQRYFARVSGNMAQEL